MKDQFGKWVYPCDQSEWENWYAEAYRRSVERKRRRIIPPWKRMVVEQWSGLPSGVARKMRIPDNLFQDAVAEGTLKMVEVACSYNPSRAQFQTVAYIAIWRHLSRWMESECRRPVAVVLRDSMDLADRNDHHEEVEVRELGKKVRSELEKIPDSDMIKMRFGIGDHEPHRYEAIARKRGIGKERIRQRVNRGLQRMAECL